MFFAMRIHRLVSKKLVVVPVIGLIIGTFGVSVAYAAKAYALLLSASSPLQLFKKLERLKALSLAMNTSAAVTDVAIAAIMCTILQHSKTGHARSNRVVNRLIAFSVNTGLLTSTCACLSLITFLALPNTYVYMAPFLLMGRLYSNSLLATLNAREQLREDLNISYNNVLMGNIRRIPSRSMHLELQFNALPLTVSGMLDNDNTKAPLHTQEAPEMISGANADTHIVVTNTQIQLTP